MRFRIHNLAPAKSAKITGNTSSPSDPEQVPTKSIPLVGRRVGRSMQASREDVAGEKIILTTAGKLTEEALCSFRAFLFPSNV